MCVVHEGLGDDLNPTVNSSATELEPITVVYMACLFSHYAPMYFIAAFLRYLLYPFSRSTDPRRRVRTDANLVFPMMNSTRALAVDRSAPVALNPSDLPRIA